MLERPKRTWIEISGTCGKRRFGEARYLSSRVEAIISRLGLAGQHRALNEVSYTEKMK